MTHGRPLDSFAQNASAIWTWLRDADNLEDLLELKLGDNQARGKNLLEKVANKTRGAWVRPREELHARHRLMYRNETAGAHLIERLEKDHWILQLFALGEFGLVRLLGFPVTDPALLPAADVVGDLPPIDLMGIYETRWGQLDDQGRLVNATLQINHAGEFLDGWLTDADLFRVDYTAQLDRTTFEPRQAVGSLLTFYGRFDHDADTFIQISDVPYPDDDFVDLVISVGFSDGLRMASTR